MALFTLPIDSASTGRLAADTKSVRYKVTLPTRKRKRDNPQQAAEQLDSLSDDEENQLAASTNPLSLTVAEIAQYKLAGLELNERLPQVKDFPHRSLTSIKSLPLRRKKSESASGTGPGVNANDEEAWVSDNGAEGSEQEASKPTREGYKSKLRLQHFKVMVAILHRCLMERDIQRALRAWTILLRFQFQGKMLDIRSTGYWAIGAELLAKSEDKNEQTGQDSQNEEEEISPVNKLEWGTKAGRAKATDYLGTLILEFPYRKTYPKLISAVDFWPSMLAIEIYGIQHEQKMALKRVAVASGQEDDSVESDNSTDNERPGDDGSNEDVALKEHRRLNSRGRRRAERAWRQREEVRDKTLTAANSLAARVDDLLSEPLYVSNITISEIRAHLALYIGDLSVPEMPLEEDDDENSINQPRSKLSDKALLHQQRIRDHKTGHRNRAFEIQRAKTIVERIIANGGSARDFQRLDVEGQYDYDDNDLEP